MPLQSIRCRCGKIVCQVDNLPEIPRIEEVTAAPAGPAAIILCRHCKRYVVLRFPSLDGIYLASETKSREASLV